jgi:hypothetical protein
MSIAVSRRVPMYGCRVLARIAIAAVLCGACTIDEPKPTYELGTFPYHPLVYELDLAILAYQLHAQSMVWPIDPYYEEHADSPGASRDAVMALVRAWAAQTGPAQIAAHAGLDAYRGPGVLAGLPDNPSHDPILYDYARIHPWSHAISNNQAMWTEYMTPDAITHRIRDVYVSARPIGGDGTSVELAQVPPGRVDADADASDVLCAFEGGTGDKGVAGYPASYSLMGFVLARDRGDGGYDVHVVFRGSRSGSAWRAVTEAFAEDQAAGNPDWITDLGWDKIHVDEISTTGGVDRGFAHTMLTVLPGAFQCLDKIGQLHGAPPAAIYVTGHSLGAALAQHFASAVLLGDAYGPAGAGPAMPATLVGWPWPQLKLVTFSAPRAGDYPWASALSKGALDSPRFYDPGPLQTVDADADVVLDPGIVTRLNDASRPAAFRVLISTDPITTTHAGGDGTHVGTTVYVNGTSMIDWLGVVNADDHEPMNVRKDMLDQFGDPSIPPVAWDYRPLTDIVPGRDPSEAGTPAEMQKLASGLVAYYAERGIYFDADAFARDMDLLFAISAGSDSR